MVYTVKQLARLANISTRTLHFYDEIGLLHPSYVKENGYRCYEDAELLILQQILFFRELEFSLEEIKKIIHAPNFNVQRALADHKKMLEMKQQKITQLIKTIDLTLTKLEGGEHMKNDDLFDSFDEKQMEEYKQEAKKRWGNTDAYKQSVERTKNWTKDDYKRIQKQSQQLTQELADCMDNGFDSQEAQKLIKKHHESIEVFYDCSYEMYRGLGQLYISDPRFTATYDKVRPGLAVWLQKAIAYYCDTHEKKSSS